MEAVLKNLSSTAELLAVAARSSVVEQWDKQTLSRAFHWARYCEHLFSRFHNNTTINRVMGKQLELTNESLRAVFPGYTDICFSDLFQCQHLLLIGLLKNPDLPISIMKILFDTASPVNNQQSDYLDVTGFCSHIIQCKSACKVLSPLTDLSGADVEVQGAVLMERLEDLLSGGGEASRTEHIVNSFLQEGEGASGHFCLVIAAALLTRNNSAAAAAAQTASQDCLLDWLQKEQNVLQQMCSALPTTLIIDLAKRHLKCRDAYCDVLKKWASSMEYSMSEGEWVQANTNRTVSFQRLTERFLALFAACPSLREDVEKELNVLNISDGDFDVRGLSVWGDLLSAINK